ncbi:MAG: NAD(P)-binding domain-containing protein [Ktedonobacteraceae bacterium]|nr:NAD(P)-binding domain-containing protein [Ktedonobacteraceae bacterium]
MKIGIIGAGNIGLAVAKLSINAGHSVSLSNTRGPASLAETVKSLGEHAQATSIEDAVAFGDISLIAIPFGGYQSIPAAPFNDKIVIDASNYVAQRDSQVSLGSQTSSEAMAAHLAGARLVKAFNTLWFHLLETEAHPEKPLDQRLVLCMASDGAQAKSVVGQFIQEIGFAPLDTGTLRDGGRLQQPDSALYSQSLTLEQARERLASAKDE